MSIAYTVVAVLLALALTGSGAAKIRRAEPVTSGLTGVGVPIGWFPGLALLELAAALALGAAAAVLGLATV